VKTITFGIRTFVDLSVRLKDSQQLPEEVRAGLGFGASSLILILVGFLPTVFLALAEGAWVEAALLLPTCLVEGPPLQLPDVALVESVMGSRAEIGVA
jgi:hypothetical protein